jgi:hypothetical protein
LLAHSRSCSLCASVPSIRLSKQPCQGLALVEDSASAAAQCGARTAHAGQRRRGAVARVCTRRPNSSPRSRLCGRSVAHQAYRRAPGLRSSWESWPSGQRRWRAARGGDPLAGRSKRLTLNPGCRACFGLGVRLAARRLASCP